MDVLERLSPFMKRAGIVEVGRDRLHQVKNKLQFLLVTEDASANSLAQMLRDFDCPVYKALTMNDVERFFGYRGTKIIGFRRHPLSNELQAALKPYLVRALQPLPQHPRVALFGASVEANGITKSSELSGSASLGAEFISA